MRVDYIHIYVTAVEVPVPVPFGRKVAAKRAEKELHRTEP